VHAKREAPINTTRSEIISC